MKSDEINYSSGNSLQNSDIINGLLAIPFFATQLASIKASIADLVKRIEIMPTAISSKNVKSTDWKSRELVSLKECALILDQSDKTVKNLIKRGLLEQSRGTRHVKITTRSLIEYVDRTV
jgi:hypothetical protein